VEAENPGCTDCSLQNFGYLIVEALIARISDECVTRRPRGLPFPFCNGAYDQDLGFPRRLDSYTFSEQGDYLPRITVEWVRFDP
jgi:hypothetical protein